MCSEDYSESLGPKISGKASGKLPWVVIIACFLAVFLDGFDTAMMGASVPAMAEEWGLNKANFTTPLVLTNVGVAIGYFTAGVVGEVAGKRKLLIAATLLCGVFTLLGGIAVLQQSMVVLSLSRILAGISIGWVLPVANSVAADNSPEQRRQRVSVMVTLGLSVGLTAGGLLGSVLIRAFGASGMFWFSAAASVVATLIVAAVAVEPAPTHVTAADKRRNASPFSLFAGSRALNTLLLWIFAFAVFLATYTMQAWLPSFLANYGMSSSQAPVGIALWSFGGIFGGIALIIFTARIGVARSLVVMSLIGVLAILVAGTADLGATVGLFVLLVVAGFGTTACQIGQLSLAVAIYPKVNATTGIGAAAGVGRLGSIVGPGVGGILVAQNMPADQIMLMASVPVLLAACCAGLLSYRLNSKKSMPERIAA